MGSASLPAATGRQIVADGALALGCAGLSVSVLASPPFSGTLGPPAWALALLHAAPLIARRLAPRSAFAVSLAAATAFLAAGYPMVGLALTGLAVVYSVAAYTSFPESLVALAVAEVALGAALAIGGQLPEVDTLVADVLALGGAWLLGDAARRRWRLTAMYRERAEELEAAQTELARRAVVEERLRIARELHDVVAHSMSVISVQAGTARTVLPDDAHEAREGIAAIEASSRAALDEMRRLLGVLRDPGEAARVAPLPTLADLDALFVDAADGGVRVEAHVEGERRPLAPGVELTAYRIVQEALTNVRRHAPGSCASVRVTFAPAELVVRVENPVSANGGAGDGTGLGVTGMRERAAVYGGSVEAGPRADGTYRVVARLPYGER